MKSVNKVLAAASVFALIASSISHAECTTVIKVWRGIEVGATIGNALSAARKNQTPGMRTIGTVGAAAGVYSISVEEQELNLIDNARTQTSSKAMVEFETKVQEYVTAYHAEVRFTRQELMSEIGAASAQNAICSRWYGAKDVDSMARVIGDRFLANPPTVLQAPATSTAGNSGSDGSY